MLSYFTRVSQIKEQLKAVEEKVEEGEIFMTTLNSLPIEARLITREEKMGATEDQALVVHTRKNYKKKEKKENYQHNKKKDKKQKKTNRDPSNVRCYTCDEKGHFVRDCRIKKKRHHAHNAKENEPTNKIFRREKDDSDEEYVLISTLTGTITHGSND